MHSGVLPPGAKPRWDDMSPVGQAYLLMFITIWKHDQAEWQSAMVGANPTYFF